MLKFLSSVKSGLKSAIGSGDRPERVDAKRVYAKIMKQARNPVFFTNELVEDSTDGRMEWLSAHLAVLMHRLYGLGGDGATLSQALYDVMIEDFDVALREESLSDSGVKHRIKPLAKMFLTRVKTYRESIENGPQAMRGTISRHIFQSGKSTEKPANSLADYLMSFSSDLKRLSLDDIAKCDFDFPVFQNQ